MLSLIDLVRITEAEKRGEVNSILDILAKSEEEKDVIFLDSST